MKSIVQLVGVLDEKIIDKLIYLDKLVKLYAKFMDTWRAADVHVNDENNIVVKFFKVNKYGYTSYTEREFSFDDLSKRIISYKGKIEREFKKRHENPRLLREKETYKWKKYIENANI